MNENDVDAFCQWLCEREHVVVGRPGMIFHCPLALWMSEITGHVYGVDGRLYGRACTQYQRWLLLPRWAEVFVAWSESVAFRPITGMQALMILAGVNYPVREHRACPRLAPGLQGRLTAPHSVEAE